MTRPTGVSVVLPVYNGRRSLRAALDAIDAQRDGRPFEVIAVDDGSRDGSRRILAEAARAGRLTMIDGPCRGIAAAINAGVAAARLPDRLPGRSGRHPRTRLARASGRGPRGSRRSPRRKATTGPRRTPVSGRA